MRALSFRLLPLCLGLASAVQAQQLQLFEPVEPAGPDRLAADPGPEFSGPASTAGNLRLRSSSRFGDDYHVVLVDAAGSALALRWRQGQTVPVPQHAGYAVVNLQGSELWLQQPASRPCVPDPAAGVRCVDAQTAVLSLVTASPLPAGASAPNASPGPEPFSAPVDDAAFINPFELPLANQAQPAADEQAREERARARAERLQQFQVERIPEDQVPPGMRLVRTPFGDRLVPVRQ